MVACGLRRARDSGARSGAAVGASTKRSRGSTLAAGDLVTRRAFGHPTRRGHSAPPVWPVEPPAPEPRSPLYSAFSGRCEDPAFEGIAPSSGPSKGRDHGKAGGRLDRRPPAFSRPGSPFHATTLPWAPPVPKGRPVAAVAPLRSVWETLKEPAALHPRWDRRTMTPSGFSGRCAPARGRHPAGGPSGDPLGDPVVLHRLVVAEEPGEGVER